MSSRALVKTTFWFVQLPVSDSEHFLARSSSSLTLSRPSASWSLRRTTVAALVITSPSSW